MKLGLKQQVHCRLLQGATDWQENAKNHFSSGWERRGNKNNHVFLQGCALLPSAAVAHHLLYKQLIVENHMICL